jgi:hypothetical protein
VPVLGEELAPQDLVLPDLSDQLVVILPLGQLGRKKGRWEVPTLGRTASREQRDDAPHAVHELQVGDEFARFAERVSREQRRPIQHDQNIVLGRRKLAREGLELLVIGRVGLEQLAEGIVDLQAR